MQTARTAAESARLPPPSLAPFPKVLDLRWLQLMGGASPERPASRVAQLLLIGLSRQVNWTFADDGRGPPDQSAWGREGRCGVRGKPRAVNCRPLVVTEKLTLRSDGLAEDNRCAVLYRLDSCSGHSLQGETQSSECAVFFSSFFFFQTSASPRRFCFVFIFAGWMFGF